MPAYLLLLFAILSRLLPHGGWMNFTAVGGALLYFGARRSWREMLGPLTALMATDYLLTVFAYRYPFDLLAYLPTWAWYAAALALGHILLRSRTTVLRVAVGALLGPTSFWLVSNYAVWAGGTMYPRTWSACKPVLRRLSRSIATTWRRQPSWRGWRLGCRCWCGGLTPAAKACLRWRGSRSDE